VNNTKKVTSFEATQKAAYYANITLIVNNAELRWSLKADN